jgi:3-dehydroquinate synthase
MKHHSISVTSSAENYSVVCETGCFGNIHRDISALGEWSSLHLITSPRVRRALGKQLPKALGNKQKYTVHLMDDGENAKTLQTVEKTSRSLIRAGADRRSLLIAVGGGVVGDVAGFVAASYLRGTALIHVPTTLVAQVDSSIGGKTGVNLPEGKNLVGAFYPPLWVIIDPLLLKTLPPREFRSGLAEVIKYGIIADSSLFASLEKEMPLILRRDSRMLNDIIRRSVKIKARVVSKDERESGLREILNFGHTFAHALETLTRYRHFRHGEAVAWGMMCAALLGHEIGLTPADHVSRIVTLVRSVGPLPEWPRLSASQIIQAMRSDKKAQSGKIRFVLTPKIGHAKTYDSVPLSAVERVLRFAPHFLRDGTATPPSLSETIARG